MPTVVKKWGIKKAILYGDFLYTKTFQGLNSLENTDIADVLINCAEALIEGEFNQLKIKDSSTFSMTEYFDVIEKKTAVLFSGVLKCLGIEAKLPADYINDLEQLGLSFGRAFQINDINQYVLNNSGKFIRSKIIYLYGLEIGVKKPKLVELASAAELIHLSTLIHDDIIDEADLRRDMPTVVKKWGIKKAILYGDFL